MTDRERATDRCRLCGTSLPDAPVETADESFCSTGCRDVFETLGEPIDEPEPPGLDPDLAPDPSDAARSDRADATAVDDRVDAIDGADGENDPHRGGEGDGEEGVGADRDDSADADRNDREADRDDSADADRDGEDDGGEPEGSDDSPIVRTYLRVDGMYSATCEAYLESIAEGQAGVTGASASYVTEAIRVDHDPTRTSSEELRDALTRTGYTAYLREDATADGADGATRRSREMAGLRKRRADDFLEMRYIVGVVFGTFLFIPYVAVLYPVYLASFSEWWILAAFEGNFESFEAPLFLSVFAVLTGAILYLTGMPLLRGAYVSLRMRRPNTHLLAALTIVGAYAYGTLAVVVGRNDVYYDLTILVAASVMAAIYYEATAKRTALDRLTELTISQVDEATLYEPDGATRTVPVGDLLPGDRVLVRQGERIPIDGTLVEGECTVDEAVVTGESLPVSKEAGDPVVGGSVVTADAAVVEVGEGARSSIDRLTRVVWNLQSADHGVGRRADELASRVLPIVAGVAVVAGLAGLVLGGEATSAALFALLAVIAASPWALALAAPLSVATSIEEALDRGIVVFDETVFERLRDVDVVVFDKTGTLTTGAMSVLEADAPDDLLRAVADVERRATHPAATAIAAAFGDDADEDGSTGEDPSTDYGGPTRSDGGPIGDRDDEFGDGRGVGESATAGAEVRDFRTHPTGVEGVVDGDAILVGHPDLFAERGWTIDPGLAARVADERGAGTLPVAVGREGKAEGLVLLGDEPRPGWEGTIEALTETGVDVVVLTGDDEGATGFFDRHPGVDHVFAGVTPDGKTAAIRRLQAEGRVAMVGDGTNDAPALAAADLGISLGSGTALASDAADIAILDDDLAAVERTFALARAARERIERNLQLAAVYHAIVVPAALLGLLNPLVAAAAVTVTGFLLLGNASRSLLPE